MSLRILDVACLLCLSGLQSFLWGLFIEGIQLRKWPLKTASLIVGDHVPCFWFHWNGLNKKNWRRVDHLHKNKPRFAFKNLFQLKPWVEWLRGGRWVDSIFGECRETGASPGRSWWWPGLKRWPKRWGRMPKKCWDFPKLAQSWGWNPDFVIQHFHYTTSLDTLKNILKKAAS